MATLLRIGAVLSLCAVLAGGCSDDTDADGPIGVAEAVSMSTTDPTDVRGFLIVTGSDVRLCEALAESFPPQCGGERLTVAGLDQVGLGALSLTTEGDVSWSDQPVTVQGTIDGGTLTVAG